MKTARSILIPVIAAILLAVPFAYAGQGGWGGGSCCKGGGPAIMGDLSKEQQQQMTALRIETMKKTEGIRSEMSKKRIELMELTSKENPDEQAIQKKKEELWALQDQMRNERRAMSTKARALLTPEQRAKLGPFGPGGGGKGFGRGCPAAL
jgi:Spy/CpxP family protein refolding chaperone